MNEELNKLYNVLSRDGYYTKSFDEFKGKWNDAEYRKKVYDVVSRDGLYTKDYNSFESKYSIVDSKKKEPTVLPSEPKKEVSSSVTAPQTRGPITSRSESSGLADAKEDGIYKYSGRKDALYKLSGGKWYVSPNGKGKFVELDDPEGKRAAILNKQAVKADVTRPAAERLKDYEDLRDLSVKETADALGWSEEEVKKASVSNKKSSVKPISANVVPDVKPGEMAIDVQANSLAKARLELGSNAPTEKINERAKYHENVNLQQSLRDRGYDVDINGDLNSDKTKFALDKMRADEELDAKEESERNRFIVDINDKITDESISSGKLIEDLRSNFSSKGFVFQEFGGTAMGTGRMIKVKYSIGPMMTTKEEAFRLDDPELVTKLRSFMAQSYMKSSEKREVLANDVNVNDEMARFEYMSDLVAKMAEAPQKYGNTLVSEDLFVNHMKSTYNYLRDEQTSISSRYEDLKGKIAAFNQNPTEEGREAINNEIHELSVRELQLTDKYEKARAAEGNFAKISSAYALEKAKTGGLFSGLAAQFGTGVVNFTQGKTMLQLSADIMPYVIDTVDPLTKNRLKSEGYSDEQIRDFASKELKNYMIPALNKGIVNVASLGLATQEYLEMGDRGVLEQTLGFLAESMGTAIGSFVSGGVGAAGALTKLAFFSQAYNGMADQMIGPEFDALTEHEKKLISVPYGLTIGALERLGFKFTTSTSKNPVLNRLISNTIARTFTSIPKDASIKTIERAISSNLAATMAQSGLRIIGGSIVEGAVEGSQQLAEIGIKNIANAIIGEDEQGFDFFKDVPDLTTADGVKEAFNLAAVDAAYGALGGAIMSTGENAVSAFKNKGIEAANQKKFLAMAATLTDSKLRALQDLKIQSELASGAITQEQADERIQSMNKATEVINKIPDGLSTKSKIESFNLLMERSDLESEIQGKDEALTVVQRERIKEINTELQEISRSTDKDADVEVTQPEVVAEEEILNSTDAKADIERQALLEKNVQDLKDKRNALRGEDGVVPKESMAEWQQLGKDIIDAKNKATRGNNEGFIPIRTEKDGVLSGEDAIQAENEIERIIQKIIKGDITVEQAISFIQNKYKQLANENQFLLNYINDRTSNAPEIGNNKQSFPAWRKGKYDAELAALEGRVEQEVTEDKPLRNYTDDNYNVVIQDPNYIARGGSGNNATEGYYSWDRSEAIQYADGDENNIFEGRLKDDANILELETNDPENYQEIEENIRKFEEITGIKYSSEEFSDIYGESRKKLKKAGYDAVRGATIDGLATVVLNEKAIEPLKTSGKLNQEVTEGKPADIKAVETNDPKTYSEALDEARTEMGKEGPGLDLQVSPVSEQEAQAIVDEGGKIFMTEDGQAGAYVKKDGYMGGLFKNPLSKLKDVAKVLQQARVKAGGRFMEGYATKLEEIYVKNGFRPVARLKFNEEFAPEGWDAENSPLKGKPDVVFFAYDPDGKFAVGDGEYVSDYDAAYEIAKNYSPEVAQEMQTTEITIDNAEEFKSKAKDIDISEKGNRATKVIQAARNVLRALPGVKVHLHTDKDSYRNGVARAQGVAREQVDVSETEGESAGSFVNGEIHIDLSNPMANARTVFHEAFHYAMTKIAPKSGDFRRMTNGLKKALSAKHADKVRQVEEFEALYTDDQGFVDQDRAQEFLSELAGIITDEDILLDTNTLQKIANVINKIAQKLIGRPVLSEAATRQEIVDFMNTLSRGMRRGEAVDIVSRVDNNEAFENEYIQTNGTVVNTPSRRKSITVNTVVSENDVIDPATLEGKPLEVVYYDNFTSSPYTLTNRVSGSTISRKGEGGPGYSYRPEIKEAGIIAAFTNVTKGLNLIQGIRSRNAIAGESAVVGVALQNKETGHLGNLTTNRDFYSPVDGEIARAVKDGVISNDDAVSMLKEAVDTYATTSKGSDSKSSLGFTSNDFNSLEDFFKKMESISFERRGTFNNWAIPSKSDLAITKSTKPFVKAWLKSGVSTLSDYYSDTTEAYTTNAAAHDIVKYLDPDLNKVGVDSTVVVSDAERARAAEMGVEIIEVDSKLIHTSYPVVLFGKNIGVPSTFHSVRSMSEEWNVPNPFFKAGRRGDKSKPVRIPKVEATERKSLTKPSTKKRLSGKPTKQSAINDAFSKYELSIDRGNSIEKARESAIADLQKNDWYKDADDTQREEAVRELRKKFGQKEKNAPSTAKILGKPKPTMVIVNEAKARTEQLRLEARAAREAKKDTKGKQAMLIDAVRAMNKSGKIDVRQLDALLNRIKRLNLDNSKSVQEFLGYAQRVFERADYQERLTEAMRINKRIKKAMKSDKVQASTAAIAKLFSKIDPKIVEDIDMYIEMAEKVFDSIMPATIKGTEVSIKTAVDYEQISEFADAEIERQEEYKRNQLLEMYEDIFEGIDVSGLSLAEIRDIVFEVSQKPIDGMPTEKKVAYIRSFVEKMMDVYKPLAKSVINGVDPFSGEMMDVNEKSARLMTEVLEMDLGKLDIRDAIAIIEAVDNFIANGVTDGLQSVLSRYKGRVNAEKIASSGVKARSTSTIGSEGGKTGFGRNWFTSIMSIKTASDLMFRGVNQATSVLRSIGFSAFENGVAKSKKMWSDYIDSYQDKFSKSKPNGKNFMDAENIIERGLYAALKRTVSGSPKQQSAEFERKVKLIKDSVNVLRKHGDSKHKKMADIYESLIEKAGLNDPSTTIEDVEQRLDKGNIDAVSWWIGTWADNYSDLYDVSLNVYNTKLDRDMFYTPDKFSTLKRGRDVEQIVSEGGGFAMINGFEYDKKSGVLMPSNKPASMESGRFLDLNFEMNNAKALKAALTDINTASSIRQISGALDSDAWMSVISDKKDRDAFRDKVDNFILRSRNKMVSSESKDFLDALEKSSRIWASMGATRALGSISQPIKQTVPLMLSTIFNAGRLDLINPLNSREANDWINKSGRGIALRGLESLSGFEDANKLIEDAVNSGSGKRVLESVERANRIALRWALSKPDVWIARSAFISYYKQYMKNIGLDADIDFTNPEGANQDALDYAQHMVDRQQNISETDLAGEFFSSGDAGRRVIRNVFFPFASFVMNQKSRMFSDFATLTSKEASTQDKVTAARSLGGLSVEMLTYHSIGFAIRAYAIQYIANAITGAIGDDEDKEDKEKRLRRQSQYMVGQVIKDVLSPVPLTDSPVVNMSDKILSLTQEALDTYESDAKKALSDVNKEREKNKKRKIEGIEAERWIAKYISENRFEISDFESGGGYGMYSITYDKAKDLYKSYNLAYNGQFIEEGFGGNTTTKYILDKDRQVLKDMFPLVAAYNLIGFPAEIGAVQRRVESHVKKQKLTEKTYDNYNDYLKLSGKKTVNEIEEYLLRNTQSTDKHKAANRVKAKVDILRSIGAFESEAKTKKYMRLLQENERFNELLSARASEITR